MMNPSNLQYRRNKTGVYQRKFDFNVGIRPTPYRVCPEAQRFEKMSAALEWVQEAGGGESYISQSTS